MLRDLIALLVGFKRYSVHVRNTYTCFNELGRDGIPVLVKAGASGNLHAFPCITNENFRVTPASEGIDDSDVRIRVRSDVGGQSLRPHEKSLYSRSFVLGGLR